MANIKFYHSNLISTTSTLKNGTGGGAPALEEDADFPMSNLKVPDSQSLWKTSGTPADPLYVDFVFNLFASQTIRAIGWTNADPANFPALGQVQVFYSIGNSYPPTWTLLADISSGLAKKLHIVEVNQAVRQLRYQFNGVPAFYVGKLLACTGYIDMGKQSARGSFEEEIKNRVRARTIGGQLSLNKQGENRENFGLSWPVANATMKGHLDTLLNLDGTFFYATHEGRQFEVTFADDRVRKIRRHDPPPLHSIDVLLEELL